MQKILIGTAVVVCATGIAFAAAGTKYSPHVGATATPVAYQSPEEDAGCSQDREILACVVQLGPSKSDRWAYALEDNNGQPSPAVKYREASPGAACAAMAYPVGMVALPGGAGEWFNGKVSTACRQ